MIRLGTALKSTEPPYHRCLVISDPTNNNGQVVLVRLTIVSIIDTTTRKDFSMTDLLQKRKEILLQMGQVDRLQRGTLSQQHFEIHRG